MTMSSRVIVVPVIRNDAGAFLICRMPPDRGVFPGLWGLPGGGIEPGETMLDALHREAREELGLTIVSADPLFFKEARHSKRYPDGSTQMVHMIFLLFDCRAAGGKVHLNEEFDAYAWVSPDQLGQFALNDQTRDTFLKMGVAMPPSAPKVGLRGPVEDSGTD